MESVRQNTGNRESVHPLRPLTPLDRTFCLFCTFVATIIAHKSLPKGWMRRTASFTILTGGTLYASGATCKCMKDTATRFFDGFGCVAARVRGHLPGRDWGSWGGGSHGQAVHSGGGGGSGGGAAAHHGSNNQRPQRFEERDG